MTPQEYEELVRDLTAEAERDPKRFEWRVLGVLAQGYGFLVGVLALTLLAITAVLAAIVFLRFNAWFALQALIPLGGLAILLANALRVEYPPPDGRQIVRSDAPDLFAEIEAVRDRVDVRRPDEVRVTGDLNAAVLQVPSLGFFGPTRDVLVVGMQLLQALTPEQLRAVLAHEFGHLSGDHGKFASWIYQVRRTWGVLLEALEKKHGGNGMFARFLEGYVPRFSATTFVLARQQEYVADRISAEVTSPVVAGSALVSILAADRRLDEQLWSSIDERVRDEAEPPADIMSELGRFLASNVPADALALWMRDALNIDTGLEDTHPALKDRLASLGVTPEEAMRPAAGPERAVSLLGPARAELERRFSAAWREVHLERWRADHEEFRVLLRRHEELAARPEESLTLAEGEEHAFSVARLSGRATAEPVYQRLLAAHPDSALANFWIGLWKLEDGDDSGLAMLERAAELDEAAIVACAQHATAHLVARDREPEARPWIERVERQHTRESVDLREREELTPESVLDPHALPDDVLAPLVALLGEEPPVPRAWLVRRHLTIRPEPPQFVLALELPARGLDAVTEEETRELLQWLVEKVALPGPTMMIVLVGRAKALGRTIKAVPGSRIL